MVRKKGEKSYDELFGPGWLDDQLNEYEKMNPIVRSIWFVCEVTPSYQYSYDNGHGQAEYDWEPEKADKVSPDFDCSGLAHEWIDDHVPDEGKSLRVYRQDLRETTTRSWGHKYPSA